MERWYVASVQPGLSKTAQEHLKRLDIVSCYLQARDSSKQVVSYFPGYIFVWLDLPAAGEPRDERLGWVRAVNGARGVGRMLPAHLEAPLPLPEGFVERLIAASEAGELDEQLQEEFQRFLAGETVKVRSGPWIGNVFEVTRYRKGALSFITSLLGQAVEVYIPQHQVEKIPDSGRITSKRSTVAPMRRANRAPRRGAAALQV